MQYPTTGAGAGWLQVVVCLALFGCGEGAPVHSGLADVGSADVRAAYAELTVVHGPTSGGGTLDLRVEYHSSSSRARVMELFIDHSSGLEFLSAESGHVLDDAGKDLVVQSLEPGKLRIVALSPTSVAELRSGELLTLHFAKQGDEKPWVRFGEQKQVFAPLLANQGLRLGPGWQP